MNRIRPSLFVCLLLLGACVQPASELEILPLDDIHLAWPECLLDRTTGVWEGPGCDDPPPVVIPLAVSVQDAAAQAPAAGAEVIVTSAFGDIYVVPRELLEVLDPGLVSELDAAGGDPVVYTGGERPDYRPGFASLPADDEGMARLYLWVSRVPQASSGAALTSTLSISAGLSSLQVRLVPDL